MGIKSSTRRTITSAMAAIALAGSVCAQSGSKSTASASQTKTTAAEGKKNNSSSVKEKTKSPRNTQRGSGDGPDITAAAGRVIDPRTFDEALLSRLIFDLTNVERSRQNLSEFGTNQYLQSAAVFHSRDMASRSYFNHKSKGIFKRTNHSDRIASTGYRPRTSAENIAMIPTFNSQRIQSYPGGGSQVVDTDHNTYGRLANFAVQQWMNSPGHRANIMNRSLTELGVGVALGMNGNIPYVYLTQNFGG